MRSGVMAQRDGETGIRPALGQVDMVELRVDLPGGPEQPEHLVHEMTSQIAQEPAGWPGLQCGRIVEIHTVVDAPDLPKPAFSDDPGQRLQIGVEATVLKDTKRYALCLRSFIQIAGVGGMAREGLVGDHVQTGSDCLQHQLSPGLRRCCDRYSVADARFDHIGQAGIDGGVWPIGLDSGNGFRRARDDPHKFAVPRRSYEGCVEVTPARSVSDNPDPQHGLSPSSL